MFISAYSGLFPATTWSHGSPGFLSKWIQPVAFWVPKRKSRYGLMHHFFPLKWNINTIKVSPLTSLTLKQSQELPKLFQFLWCQVPEKAGKRWHRDHDSQDLPASWCLRYLQKSRKLMMYREMEDGIGMGMGWRGLNQFFLSVSANTIYPLPLAPFQWHTRFHTSMPLQMLFSLLRMTALPSKVQIIL